MTYKHRMKTTQVLTLLFLLIIGTSCSHGDAWKVSGTIANLPDTIAVIESATNGVWYPMDTIEIKGGNFAYEGTPSGYPDIYRLRVGNKLVYFPIDSLEEVKVETQNLPTGFKSRLSGTPQAETFNRVEDILAKNAPDMKRKLARIVLEDPSSIVAYYIINRAVGNQPLFDPNNAFDLRVIGAVANWFTTSRPQDPRTNYLKNLFLSHLPEAASAGTKVQATVSEGPEISLYGPKGTRESLHEQAARGGVVVLNFTTYTAQGSNDLNQLLKNLLQSYGADGLSIYQVALDDNEAMWKATARELPWTAVLLPPTSEGEKVIRDYNVSAIPTNFLFNRKGELVSRIDNPDDMEPEIVKLLKQK